MSVSAVPALLDAFVAKAKTDLPNAQVYDGPGVSDDPGDYLMVGVDDPQNDPATSATTTEQAGPLTPSRPRDETGEIAFVALSQNGDGDLKGARDAVYAIAETVFAAIRANPAMGVAGVLWTGYGSTRTLSQDYEPEAGAVAMLAFRVSFRARI